MRILLSLTIGTMRNTAYLFLALPILVRPVAAQSPDAYSYQILYTGRTLGYARIPNQQTLPPSSTDTSPIAMVSRPTYYCFPRFSSAVLLCGIDPSPNSTSDKQPITNLMPAGNANLPVSPQTAAYLTPGAYLNFYWKVPIWSRRDANRADQSLYSTLTNKGDIYFNTSNDTAVQTRYLDKLTRALNFPIWAGLSLTPKVDFILYENKINPFHYRAFLHSISLSYTFSWREGMSWIRALRYGAQTTTPSPAGSTH
ncbi:MAG TPA: hypothetical protein VE077_07945 [Candidatus Methylomirabilis sp.]|nr:hypothetical protein [Candidatus Methylomirabilis sp.]